MKRQALGLIAALTLAVCTQAYALKRLMRVSPANAPQVGFTVTTKERDDGTLRFTVTRDLAKATWPGRDATLEVRGENGPLVTCRLDPERDRHRNTVTYSFDLARDRIAASTLTVAEIQTAGGREDGEKLVGGGSIYEFRLADFTHR
jgi:hypothetical protein